MACSTMDITCPRVETPYCNSHSVIVGLSSYETFPRGPAQAALLHFCQLRVCMRRERGVLLPIGLGHVLALHCRAAERRRRNRRRVLHADRRYRHISSLRHQQCSPRCQFNFPLRRYWCDQAWHNTEHQFDWGHRLCQDVMHRNAASVNRQLVSLVMHRLVARLWCGCCSSSFVRQSSCPSAEVGKMYKL